MPGKVLISILVMMLGFPVLTQESPEILSLNQIKAGMKAKARTVFEGYQIEEFDLEIIGVLKNAIGSGQHIMLAKLIGDKVAFSGVVAGMSGSPVYVDDKLIGAIAYQFGIFQKEPIAGITPIENMLEVQKYSASFIASKNIERDVDSRRLLQEMKPIATPLMCGGFHQSVFHHYASHFEELGFLPLQGGGSNPGEGNPGPFEPGAAVAVVLVSGDMDIAGTGTLTYRNGDRVLAFGHPFFMSGPVDMPMARAEIVHTLASSLSSFKMSNTTDIIGAILQDRLTAVEGKIGAKPGMIPVKVIAKSHGEPLKDFQYDIIKHKTISPILLSITISNSLANTLFYSEPISVFAELHISMEDGISLHQKKLYTLERSFPRLPFFLAHDVGQLFSKIFENRFEEPNIQKIELSLDIREGIQIASLEKIWYEKDRAKKGDTIHVKAYLRSFRGEIVEESFELAIPDDLKHRKLKVMLGDPVTLDRLRGKIFKKKLKQAKNLDDYIRLLNEQPVNHQITLILFEPSSGAIVDGALLPNLPPSIASVLSSDRGQKNISKIHEHVLYEIIRPVNFSISGVKSFTIDIE